MNVALPFVILTAGLSTVAEASIVHIKATGTVDYCFYNSGPLQPVDPGQAVVMEFNVDSDVFVNSPNYPTRGYPIIQPSFTLQLGPVAVTLANPFPAGQTPYFVIRNNDPAVDGFLISTSVDNLFGVKTSVNNVSMNFLRTFDVSTMWPSLNILDALGSYGFEHMSSYEWTFGPPLEVAYQTITLSLVPPPCPADVNGSSAVDIDDLLAVINNWGATSGPADITGNGQVDIDDLLAVINGWGACP